MPFAIMILAHRTVVVDVAVQRWQKFTGKQAILEGGEQTFDDLKSQREAA